MLAATGLLALLTACGGGSDADQSPEPGPLAPTGDVVVIEPLDTPSGSSDVTFEGVTLAVPDGWESTEADASGTTRVLSVGEPGEERSAVNLTVTPQDDVTDNDVDSSAQVTIAQLGAGGAVTGLEREAVEWEGVPYAVASHGTLALETGDRDIVLVTLRDEDGTLLAVVSAEAPAGELEDSEAYDVLRTLRVG